MLSKFSLYQKTLKTGTFWYARFYNPQTKTYPITRSTGIEVTGKNKRKKQAELKAKEMLEKLDFSKPLYFLDYLSTFWEKDSQYAKYKRLVENKPLSNGYINNNNQVIKNHVLPYKPFSKVLLSDLTTGMLEDWKLWALEKGTGRVQVNNTLKAMKVPVRHLISRGELNIIDPFSRVKNIPTEPQEKGILTKQEVTNLINTQYSDIRMYFAILLSILAGLRRGELRGLQWQDIDLKNGIINVNHNFVDTDGLKKCKWGSDRQVLLPETLLPALNKIKSISPYIDKTDYVLFSLDNRWEASKEKKPISNDSLRNGFHLFLEKSGISIKEQKKRNLTLHGMRHTFVTMARMAGVPDIAVQAMAGHKSAEMMNHYSHGGQVINLQEYKNKMAI